MYIYGYMGRSVAQQCHDGHENESESDSAWLTFSQSCESDSAWVTISQSLHTPHHTTQRHTILHHTAPHHTRSGAKSKKSSQGEGRKGQKELTGWLPGTFVDKQRPSILTALAYFWRWYSARAAW